MNCKNCPNATNGDKLGRPVITHPQGNYLQVQIKLKKRFIGVVDGNEFHEDNDLSQYGITQPISVTLVRGKKEYHFDGTLNGNSIVFTDEGNLPLGTYDLVIDLDFANESKAHYNRHAFLQIIHETATGGKYENNDANILASYPVLDGVTTAITVGDTDVTISESGKYTGDETPNDDNADISAAYGDESMVVGDDEVTLTL